VTGVFTGLIKAPMSVVSSIGGSVFGGTELSKKDRVELVKASERVIASGQVGDTEEWQNMESGVQGTVSIASMDTMGERTCMILLVRARKGAETFPDKQYEICQAEDGSWELAGTK
jgi:surface antigen